MEATIKVRYILLHSSSFMQMKQCSCLECTLKHMTIISIKLDTCKKSQPHGKSNNRRGCSTEQITEIIKLNNLPNHKIPLICHSTKQEIMQTNHATYHKIWLAKVNISSTLHTAVIYGPRSLRCIRPFDPFIIQGEGRIAFLVKTYWKSTPSSLPIRANLSTLQLEAGRGGCILENNYTGTQKWLQIESWIREVWKFMSTNHIKILHLGIEVSI